MKLTAKASFNYGGKELRPGDVYDAPDADALAMVAEGLAMVAGGPVELAPAEEAD